MTKGTILRYKRKLLGLTAQEVADFCGVTRATICNAENDKAPDSLFKLIDYELARYFMEWDPQSNLENIVTVILKED